EGIAAAARRTQGCAASALIVTAAAAALLAFLGGGLVVGVLALVLARVLDHLVRVFREVVAVDAREQVVLEVQREVLGLHLAAAAADGGDIVPAVLVEWADHRGRAHHEQHLALAHAGLE